MADLRPFAAVRYDPAVAGPLGDLVAPPYDVIDAGQRIALQASSPYNAVRLELPDPPYEAVGDVIAAWIAHGVLRRTARPGLAAWTQTFTIDGVARERRTLLATVGVEPYSARVVRPHERTHSGPKEDRLRLLHGAGHQISPVYGLYPDAGGEVWAAVAPAGTPEAEFGGGDGTLNRLWWVDDPAVCAAAAAAMRDRWILIADGHHRYETAVRFREERRAAGAGDGPHDVVMMGLTAIEDPGLVVLPTHRVLAEAPEGLLDGFELQPVDDLAGLRAALAASDPGRPAFGVGTTAGAVVARCPAPTDPSPAAHLDVAVLEDRVFRRVFGEDQAALAHRGALSYVKDTVEAWTLGRSGRAAAVFVLRDMPKDAVVAVAEAGETMPQKSTYFFPKLLTGVAFHPLLP